MGAEAQAGMNQLRHISTPRRTTIRLEQPFWSVIDHQAEAMGIHWRELVKQMLAGKPDGQSVASWLRVYCLGRGE